MPAKYSALQTDPKNANRELEEAFDSEEEDFDERHQESTPLRAHRTNNRNSASQEPINNEEFTSTIPGGYDFERDEFASYDRPPPGSPPLPSARALPNDIGNSNGLIPSSPVRNIGLPLERTGFSFFRRTVGAILPTHYAPLPSTDSNLFEGNRSMTRGGGTDNDGVFANVTAKPQALQTVLGENGEVHFVPETTQKDAPPSYADAQADAVPTYWETTVHAPNAIVPDGEMIVDDLPTGSVASFAVNLSISFFFQFVGFALTYVLHTSHAAKQGSRAGLGLTLIQFGFYSRFTAKAPELSDEGVVDFDIAKPLSTRGISPTATTENGSSDPFSFLTTRDLIAFLLMTLGWFFVMSATFSFWRVKRFESSIRASSQPESTSVPEESAEDRATRRNIEILYFGGRESPEPRTPSNRRSRQRQQNNSARSGPIILNEQALAAEGLSTEEIAIERRLVNNLAAAGLI